MTVTLKGNAISSCYVQEVRDIGSTPEGVHVASRASFLLPLSLVASSALATGPPAAAPAVAGVAVAPPFFNPSAGQDVTIRFDVSRGGHLAVTVLDRDRLPVRRLLTGVVTAGPQRVTWDGRDDAGTVVPDEAYSLRIELADSDRREIYDPSEHFTPLLQASATGSYSRASGVLSYSLARPARVHIQAGQAKRDARTGRVEGPILKTVVDRAPRVAGAVIETWNGMDESGTIYVPDLPHFAVAILAASLPENPLITVGNRRLSFADYAPARPPSKLAPRSSQRRGAHHAGLSAIEDRSPRLQLHLGGAWDETQRLWTVGRNARLTAEIVSGNPRPFLAQPTRLMIYLDDVLLARRERPDHPAELTLDLGRLSPGEHRLVVNWVSLYGPVAVGAARIVVRGGAAPKETK